MNIREELEYQEHRRLNPLAAFADQSKGRLREEEPRMEEVRTCYQRDIDRVVHCKAFRRLVHKTQVFLRPEGDHYRTRMTHTLECPGSPGPLPGAWPQRGSGRGHCHGPRPGPHSLRHAGESALSDCWVSPSAQ